MVTVRELLRDLDVSVHAGEGGLDAAVRWVHISEVPDPTPWLSGGELLLTTGLPLDSAKRQREYVARLAEHRLAGLGLGTGFTHADMPPALVAEAEARGFPLFEVPYEVPFIAITERAATRLVNEQYAVLRRSISAHERLERMVLSERGLDAVAGALASLVGAAVLVFDARGDLLAQRASRGELDEGLVSSVRDQVRARDQTPGSFPPSVPDPAGRAIALPVAASGPHAGSGSAPQAWIVAVKDAGEPSEFDRLTLQHAVTIVGLELLRRRVAEDTERRLAGDVIAAVLSGELAGRELARRLEPFGLHERVAALVVARPGPGRTALAACESAVSDALRGESVSGLVAATGSSISALVPGLDDDDSFTLARRVADRVAAELGLPVRMGAGRAVSAGDARRTFHEARCALEAQAMAVPVAHANGNSNGSGPPTGGAEATVATYRDLGSFQLLLSLQEDEALKLFCDSILGPIETSEGAYGGELMRSLEAFIEENGQWERAAKRLFCHRHTLRYRIRKVEELTGRDLGSARDRIEFWLALRGRELVT